MRNVLDIVTDPLNAVPAHTVNVWVDLQVVQEQRLYEAAAI